MPLARMMARSEAMQEHASGNPGLQTFLDKKSDEHVYSALYLLAGIFCLYAAIFHSESFCTQALPDGLQAQAHPQSLSWFVNLMENTTDVFPGNNTGIGELVGDLQHKSFAGRSGFVVMWLWVEGITALGLPLLSVVMLILGLRDHVAVGCLLFVVAVFQALWLTVGCFWSFGHYVPVECISGQMGDNFAFKTMWWVCAVWLGIMVLISGFMLCVVCCIMAVAGNRTDAGADNKGPYQSLGAGGNNASKDPTDQANRYV